MTFDPQKHLIKIKTRQGMKDYLNVQWRLAWFREHCQSGTIETELVHLDLEKKLAVFKAIVADGNGALAMGHGSECEKDFTDYIEKAETKALGRALAALGFGTQFTGDELDEGARIVDAPVEPQIASASSGNIELDAMPPSNGQLENIRQLALHLGTKIQKPKTFKEAAQMLDSMQSEWDQMKSRGRAS